MEPKKSYKFKDFLKQKKVYNFFSPSNFFEFDLFYF